MLWWQEDEGASSHLGGPGSRMREMIAGAQLAPPHLFCLGSPMVGWPTPSSVKGYTKKCIS